MVVLGVLRGGGVGQQAQQTVATYAFGRVGSAAISDAYFGVFTQQAAKHIGRFFIAPFATTVDGLAYNHCGCMPDGWGVF